MSWIVDEYSTLKGEWSPGIVTGKPIEVGGSLGRNEATGRGCLIALQCYLAKKGLDIKNHYRPRIVSPRCGHPLSSSP